MSHTLNIKEKAFSFKDSTGKTIVTGTIGFDKAFVERHIPIDKQTKDDIENQITGTIGEHKINRVIWLEEIKVEDGKFIYRDIPFGYWLNNERFISGLFDSSEHDLILTHIEKLMS